MIRSDSNLILGVAWFFIWGVLLLNASSTSGFWVPIPDPRNPVLLLLSIFFYGPPLLIVLRQWANRSDRLPERAERTLRFVSIALLAGLALLSAVLAFYAVGTL